MSISRQMPLRKPLRHPIRFHECATNIDCSPRGASANATARALSHGAAPAIAVRNSPRCRLGNGGGRRSSAASSQQRMRGPGRHTTADVDGPAPRPARHPVKPPPARVGVDIPLAHPRDPLIRLVAARRQHGGLSLPRPPARPPALPPAQPASDLRVGGHGKAIGALSCRHTGDRGGCQTGLSIGQTRWSHLDPPGLPFPPLPAASAVPGLSPWPLRLGRRCSLLAHRRHG